MRYGFENMVYFALTASSGDPSSVQDASACNGYQDDSNFIAAASDKIWENRRACEKYYTVKCIGATNKEANPCKKDLILVRIVDYCHGPRCGTITLSEDAFSDIADLKAERVRDEYKMLGA
ncbi:EG45-like domain containing protein [Corylus avellana]|uniref:EG45-like domain containing protein n=1 Tax=Corylus avellana TaxID=13451 RepID=UPI00286A8AE3|nr:EG45-like domain containing protein [Corylus avellana]